MKTYLKLIRPKHWTKNLIIFLPSFFAGEIIHSQTIIILTFAFFSWSFMASFGYILNDILDITNDRLHPIKRHRPLASGDAKIKPAILLLMVLFMSSILLSIFININTIYVLFIYIISNWLYSTKVKQLRFFDIIFLSGFYILRIFFGATATNIIISPWLMVTCIFIFVSLSLSKRKMECEVIMELKLLGKAYDKSDYILLQILQICTSFVSLIFLNLHSIFVLEIHDTIWFVLLNFSFIYILFNYFDTKVNVDDPVDKIFNNYKIVICLLIVVLLYTYKIFILNS